MAAPITPMPIKAMRAGGVMGIMAVPHKMSGLAKP
jgi:hypothetical protein